MLIYPPEVTIDMNHVGEPVSNVSMQKALEGDCIDVDTIGEPHPNFPGVWTLYGFMDGMDYCAANFNEWIYSIGALRNPETGRYTFYAATDNRFYQNPKFICAWLR
jgi:hypothetical protein